MGDGSFCHALLRVTRTLTPGEVEGCGEVEGRVVGWMVAPKQICPCPNPENLGMSPYLENKM